MKGGDGEADAVEGDGAFGGDEFHEVARGFDGEAAFGSHGALDEAGGAVDVALDEVAVEAIAGLERPLDVDAVAGLEQAEVGFGEGFGDDVEADLAGG